MKIRNRKLIALILVFAVIAAGMTLEFSLRMKASVVVLVSASESDSNTVLSGGIVRYPEAGTYAWVVFVLSLMICGAMVLLILRSGWRPEKLFLAIAIPLGVIYLFMMTPMAIPDEQAHYEAAYRLSSIFCFQPGKGMAEHFDYSGMSGHYNTSFGYDWIIRNFMAPMKSTEEISLRSGGLDYPLMYVPQAVGLTISRLLGGNLATIFLTGRLFNLLFYSFCVYQAIRLTPKYKTLFVMTGMLPMALHQAASFSYDAFIIGGILLLTAMIFRVKDGQGIITVREFGLIVLTGLLVIPAKPTNYPILLLYLLIPSSRFRNAKQRWLWLIGAWVMTMAVVLLIQRSGIASVAASGQGGINWRGGKNYTLSYVFSNPKETAKVYLRTLRRYGSELVYESIGSVAAGLTMPLPQKYFSIYLALMILCVLRGNEGTDIVTGKNRIILLGVSVLVLLLTMTTMFLTWTMKGEEYIQGLQGRYFIPLLPLVLICLDNDYLRLTKDAGKFALTVGIVMHMGIIMEILCNTMLN